MSHHTSLSVKYSGTCINFPPVQSCFELSLAKASSDAAGGGYISQPPSITSGVLRAPSTTAIFNRNRDFQRQPRPNFPCMGSGNRNHHHDLQIAIAVDQNFLIFGGRFGHQRRGPTLLLSENWERLNRSVAACVGRPSTATATAIWLHIAVAIEIAVVDGALYWGLVSSLQVSRNTCFLCILYDRHSVAIALWCLEKKNRHIGPLPHPLPSPCSTWLHAITHN